MKIRYRIRSGEALGSAGFVGTTGEGMIAGPGEAVLDNPAFDDALLDARPDKYDRQRLDLKQVPDSLGRLVGRGVWDGEILRLATRAELDTFVDARQADEKAAVKQMVAARIDKELGGLPVRTMLLMLLDEINALRAAMIPPLPPRTKQQTIQAYKNKVNSAEVD